MIFSGGEPHILTLVTTQKWEILRERETVGTDYPKPLRNDTGPSPWADQKVVRTPAPPLVLITKDFFRLEGSIAMLFVKNSTSDRERN